MTAATDTRSRADRLGRDRRSCRRVEVRDRRRNGRIAAAAGTVSLQVTNTGMITHELVVLSLAAGQRIGARTVGADGKVDEAGSLGEASNSGGSGSGEGIEPGASSRVTVTLAPGRYELVCNLMGHYVSGMHRQLKVT